MNRRPETMCLRQPTAGDSRHREARLQSAALSEGVQRCNRTGLASFDDRARAKRVCRSNQFHGQVDPDGVGCKKSSSGRGATSVGICTYDQIILAPYGVRGGDALGHFFCGAILSMTTPCEGTSAAKAPRDEPRSSCFHRSRTSASTWEG